VHKLYSHAAVLHFATAQHGHHFDLVAVIEEFFCVTELNLIVMILDFVTHLYLFDIGLMLSFLGFFSLFVLFELIASVVHYFGHRRDSIWLNEEKVQTSLFGLG